MRFYSLLIIMIMLVSLSISAIDKVTEGKTMALDNDTADQLLQKADEIFQKRDYENALLHYEETLKLATQEFNRSVETEALSQIARMNLLLNQKEKGREFLNKATEKANDSDPMGFSRYLGVKGRFEWRDNSLTDAQGTFEKMYVYCNTNALWSRAVDAAHMIAIVAESPETQIEWGRRGIEAAEAGGVESWLGPLWNNLAGTYYDIKQFDSALECYLKAREYHWKYSGEIAKLFADYHVGMTYRYLGKFNDAESWLRPVLAWAERLGNHSAIGQANEELGEIQVAKGKIPAGLTYLKKARDEYKAAGFDKNWKEIWDNINNRIKDVEN